MTNYIVDADHSDNGKTELELLYEMQYDDVHRILETAADRSVVGLPKRPAFGLRGLHRPSRITTGPPKEPYLPINLVSAVPEELCEKLNHLVQIKETENQT